MVGTSGSKWTKVRGPSDTCRIASLPSYIHMGLQRFLNDTLSLWSTDYMSLYWKHESSGVHIRL